MSQLKALWTVSWKVALFLVVWGVLYAPPPTGSQKVAAARRQRFARGETLH